MIMHIIQFAVIALPYFHVRFLNKMDRKVPTELQIRLNAVYMFLQLSKAFNKRNVSYELYKITIIRVIIYNQSIK